MRKKIWNMCGQIEFGSIHLVAVIFEVITIFKGRNNFGDSVFVGLKFCWGEVGS